MGLQRMPTRDEIQTNAAIQHSYGVLKRIAEALERIADKLEESSTVVINDEREVVGEGDKS